MYYPPFEATTNDDLVRKTVIALRAYVMQLNQYPPDVLEKAWRTVQRNLSLEDGKNKWRKWPDLRLIQAECRKIMPYHEVVFSPNGIPAHVSELMDKAGVTMAQAQSWLVDTRLDGDVLVCRSKFVADWLRIHYEDAMRKAWGFRPKIVVGSVRR
ncbi:hypothetical protein [Nostoc linckia]|nr:hypothetical protein [Nostoc linckia]